MIDIFNDDAFSVVSMSGVINDMAFVPGRCAELGIFGSGEGIATTTAYYEREGDILSLVPPTERGGPGTTVKTDADRDLVPVSVPHFEINDSVMAESVQNVRAFGSDGGQLETVQSRVAQKFSRHVNNFAATSELSRIGAVKGVITYSNGKSVDLFSTFGVTQAAEIDLDLDNVSPAEGALRRKCANIVRVTANSLGGLMWSGKVRAFVGDNFFDELLSTKEVRDTYKGWTEAQILREGYIEANGKSFGAFEFGDIIWENYRGSVGNTTFVNTDKAHFFPEGVAGLFDTIWAPADYEETVNTIGQRLYAKQYPMPNGKGRNLDTQMNELNICTRPKVLLQGKRT
jgi:hypothetical protein